MSKSPWKTKYRGNLSFITHGIFSYYPALQNRALRPGNCSGCEEKDPHRPKLTHDL
jgi:hypothetical protein